MIKRYIGVDLSASDNRITYIAFLSHASTNIGSFDSQVLRAKSYAELITIIINWNPVVVSIDAPLDLSDIDEKGFRAQDRCALRRGARLLPIKTRGMKELAKRGAKLADILKTNGINVIETHPYSSAHILGYESTRELSLTLFNKKLLKGEADALVAAYVGHLFDRNLTLSCGGDPPFILPRGCVS